MRIRQETIGQVIDDLITTVYPNLHRSLVLMSSNTDAYDDKTNHAFTELKNEIYSMYNYDVKLIFPAILSTLNSSGNFKNFDVFTMLDLLVKKEEKVFQTFENFENCFDLERLEDREFEFFKHFKDSFVGLHKELGSNVKHWVREKVRS